MPFSFIHTADWQIGKPFGRFAQRLAGQLDEARLTAIERIATHAKATGAEHVIVAGDVFDQETPSDATIRKPLDILRTARHVTWWLLPGNHDPARPNGLWERLRQQGLPSTVRLLVKAEPVELVPGVFGLPAPWTSKNPGIDLTAWMDECPTPESAIRIGIAHGSMREFAGDASQSSVIDDQRARRAGLDYLALGDWHGVKKIDARTWYAGTPEPDRFPANDPGWCLSVRVEAPQATPVVTPLATASHKWIKAAAQVVPGMSPDHLLASVLGSVVSPRKTLLQLKLAGRIGLAERSALQAAIEERTSRLAFLEAETRDLLTLVEADDLDRLDHSGSVRAAAERLMSLSAAGNRDSQSRRDATRALELLFVIAGAAEGAQS